MAAKDLGPLDWKAPIVDTQGRPSPEFQRRWNLQRNNNALIGTITFGAGPPTGTPQDGAEYVNTATAPFTVFLGRGGAWHQAGAVAFTDLTDAPHTYVASAGKFAQVNPGATGLQFSTAITSIIAGTGLSGGTITTTGTIALANTAVTPGVYTNANLTVDAQGRITAAANGSGGASASYLPLANGDAAPLLVFGNGQVIGVTVSPAKVDTRLVAYLATDVFANRPATPNTCAGAAPCYFANDTSKFFIWSGAAWIQVN